MSYPLLENIDRYVKENGIATQEVYVSSKRLPRVLIEAATRELSKNGIEYKLDDTFIVSYDNNGHLSLVLTFNGGKTNLVITDTQENLVFPNTNFRFTKLKSEKIFSKAKKIEWVDKKVYLTYDELYKKYLKKYEDSIEEVEDEKEKERRKRVLFKKKNTFKELLSDQLELLLDSNNLDVDLDKNSLFDKQLQELENVVEQYIAYINKETIERAKEKANSDIVFFVPEEPEGNIRRSGAPRKNVEEYERKNNVLSSEYRDEVINTLNPIMTKVAMSKVKVKIYGEEELEDDFDSIYTCNLIGLGNNEYKLIMEPFNGMRYTKVAYFIYDGEITDEILCDIIKKYVSLNTEHVLESNNMVRIGHTTPDAFLNSVLYAVLRDKRLKCRKYFTDKVDGLVPEVIEKQKTL